MTTIAVPVPIRRRSPQDIAARCHRVLDAALAVHDLWGHHADARAAADGLDTALEEYRAVESGDVHWESMYPDLRGEADPHGEALAKLAGEAVHAAGFLFLAITATCGLVTANAIRHAAITGGTTPGNQAGPQISPAGQRADAPRSQP